MRHWFRARWISHTSRSFPINISLFSSVVFGLAYSSIVSFFPAFWRTYCLFSHSKKQNHLIRKTSIGRAKIKCSNFCISKGIVLLNRHSLNDVSWVCVWWFISCSFSSVRINACVSIRYLISTFPCEVSNMGARQLIVRTKRIASSFSLSLTRSTLFIMIMSANSSCSVAVLVFCTTLVVKFCASIKQMILSSRILSSKVFMRKLWATGRGSDIPEASIIIWSIFFSLASNLSTAAIKSQRTTQQIQPLLICMSSSLDSTTSSASIPSRPNSFSITAIL